MPFGLVPPPGKDTHALARSRRPGRATLRRCPTSLKSTTTGHSNGRDRGAREPVIGPGGQHANVTASRIEASFEIAPSSVLERPQKDRLARRHGRFVTAVAQDARSQARNRALALERLADRIRAGSSPAAPASRRRPTRRQGAAPLAPSRRLQRARRHERQLPADHVALGRSAPLLFPRRNSFATTVNQGRPSSSLSCSMTGTGEGSTPRFAASCSETRSPSIRAQSMRSVRRVADRLDLDHVGCGRADQLARRARPAAARADADRSRGGSRPRSARRRRSRASRRSHCGRARAEAAGEGRLLAFSLIWVFQR